MCAATRPCTTLLTLVLVAGLLLASCDSSAAVPTLTSLEMAETHAFLTQSAPPLAFQGKVNFAPIDKHLEALPHWHYVVSLSFEGFFADTGKKTSGTISAEVYSNELVGERRVIVRVTGDAFGPAAQQRNVEGVRLGNDFYFVDQNGGCSAVNEDPSRRRVAELTAGSLIGGVRESTFTNTVREINAVRAWQFAFLPGNVDTPSIEMTQGGSARIASGELWIAPSLNVVMEYGLTLELTSVILPTFQGDRQLTGSLRVSYRLVEINVPYNIAIPFGC